MAVVQGTTTFSQDETNGDQKGRMTTPTGLTAGQKASLPFTAGKLGSGTSGSVQNYNGVKSTPGWKGLHHLVASSEKGSQKGKVSAAPSQTFKDNI